jgi:hypothetical protein
MLGEKEHADNELGLTLPSLTVASLATAAQFRELGERWCSEVSGGGKLVYILDNVYQEGELDWNVLQGKDEKIAEALIESR